MANGELFIGTGGVATVAQCASGASVFDGLVRDSATGSYCVGDLQTSVNKGYICEARGTQSNNYLRYVLVPINIIVPFFEFQLLWL